MEERSLLVSSTDDLSLFYVLLIRVRPKEFAKSSAYPEDSDEEESTVGKMPPSDSDSE